MQTQQYWWETAPSMEFPLSFFNVSNIGSEDSRKEEQNKFITVKSTKVKLPRDTGLILTVGNIFWLNLFCSPFTANVAHTKHLKNIVTF